MNSFSWNMRDVPAAERFAYWREAVCQTYLPLEPENLSAGSFDGTLRSFSGAALQLSRVNTVASSIRRTPSGIGRLQDGSFFANLQISGRSRRRAARSEPESRGAGDIVLVDTNEPFAICFAQGCDLICATLPGDGLRRHLRRMTPQPATVISGHGAGRLASAYLGALEDIPDDLDLVDDLAADQLSALLLRAISAGIPVNEARGEERDLLPRILRLHRR